MTMTNKTSKRTTVIAMNEIINQYDFVSVERSMYKWWEGKGYFEPGGDPKKKSYVVPMPPPNVTGYLHMGHAMGTTLQVRLLSVIVFLLCLFLKAVQTALRTQYYRQYRLPFFHVTGYEV